jgi:hypothetical protein
VPAVGTTAAFIAGLADLVEDALERSAGLASDSSRRQCPWSMRFCPCEASVAAVAGV